MLTIEESSVAINTDRNDPKTAHFLLLRIHLCTRSYGRISSLVCGDAWVSAVSVAYIGLFLCHLISTFEHYGQLFIVWHEKIDSQRKSYDHHKQANPLLINLTCVIARHIHR